MSLQYSRELPVKPMTLLMAWQHLFPDFGDVELLENIGSGQVGYLYHAVCRGGKTILNSPEPAGKLKS